jgi:hypothetical protein
MFEGREYTKKVANNLTCLIKLQKIIATPTASKQ